MKPIPLTETQMAELFRLREENAEQKKRIAELGEMYNHMSSSFFTQHNQLTAAQQQNAKLISDMDRLYKMLLSEPDTKGALFKAENILREALAEGKEK